MISRPGHKAPTEPSDEKVNARRFERRVSLSRFALILERMWEALLWPFLVISLFLIVSLFELWGALPPLAHRILLFGFGIALLASFVPLIRMTWPTRQEALRRLERDAGIRHRPATSYEDRLGDTASGEAMLLWHAHRDRLARLVARLKPRWPDPRTDRSDPFALRAVLLLLLFVGFLSAGSSSWDRIRQAFTLAPRNAVALMRLDAWVAPPVYTQLAPIVLADGTEPVGTGAESFRALQVPERSELIVRAHAPQGETLSLITDKEDGGSPVTIEPKKSGSQGLVEFNVKLTENGSADVRVGGATVAKWRFAMIKDETPTINLMGNPTVTPRGALRLVFHAEDDHGVASSEAKFALAEGQLGTMPVEGSEPGAKPDPLLEPPSMRLQLPRANQKIVDGKATQDLTSHPWAGLKVNMVLTARDQAGQSGSSQPYEFTLPERNFTKALARALVEQRKKLVREPDSAERVARALDALTLGGEKAIDNTSIYLAIRNAFWRLANDQSREGIASVVGQLWDIALKIEDGDLPEAERAVKEAQEKLSEALAKDATPEEIGRLVNELREALGQYLKSLAERQQRDQQQGEPNQASDQEVSPQDLDKMLKNIEQLAKSGSKDMAQDMLAELKDVLDQLETGKSPSSAKDKRAEKMMNDLKEMVGKQQKLLDDTYKAKRQAADGSQPGEEFEVSPPGQPMEWGNNMNMNPLFELPQEGDNGKQDPNARGKQNDQGQQGDQGEGKRGRVGQGSSRYGSLGSRQGDIQQQLQSLIDRMRMEGAEAPQQFEGAGKSMKEAKDALGDENLDHAAQAESQALDQLHQGAEAMAQQMSENGENKEGRGQGNSGRDPLGRPDRTNRPDLGLSVKVPDAIDIQRAREVLDEVRRRLGDPSRPPIELDYLERLIRSY
jgi:uncharacterized protein (TIGR02302 family)